MLVPANDASRSSWTGSSLELIEAILTGDWGYKGQQWKSSLRSLTIHCPTCVHACVYVCAHGCMSRHRCVPRCGMRDFMMCVHMFTIMLSSRCMSPSSCLSRSMRMWCCVRLPGYQATSVNGWNMLSWTRCYIMAVWRLYRASVIDTVHYTAQCHYIHCVGAELWEVQ